MRRLACIALVAALPLSACLTTVPDHVGYEINDGRVRWVGVSPGSLFLDVYRAEVREADVATFRIIDTDYAADVRHVFFRGSILPDENPAVFRSLPERYAIGSAHVYYWGDALPGANPSTWRRLEGTDFSIDGARAYYRSVFLEDADAATFRSRAFAVRWKNHSNDFVARDAYSFYRQNIRIGTIADCGRKIGDGPFWTESVDASDWHRYWGQEELDYLCTELKLPGEARG